jgi:hypothetical protein
MFQSQDSLGSREDEVLTVNVEFFIAVSSSCGCLLYSTLVLERLLVAVAFVKRWLLSMNFVEDVGVGFL